MDETKKTIKSSKVTKVFSDLGLALSIISIIGFIGNMVFLALVNILWVFDVISDMPAFMQIESIFTGIWFIFLLTVVPKKMDRALKQHQEIIRKNNEEHQKIIDSRIKKANRKIKEKMKELEINNENWQQYFRDEMLQKLQSFKNLNQITLQEEKKFIRIVSITQKEIKEELAACASEAKSKEQEE